MPVKKKNGKYCKCFWCDKFPPRGCKHTYTHININHDPPIKNFCTKKCLDLWVFRENHRKIIGFSNLNEQLFIYTKFN